MDLFYFDLQLGSLHRVDFGFTMICWSFCQSTQSALENIHKHYFSQIPTLKRGYLRLIGWNSENILWMTNCPSFFLTSIHTWRRNSTSLTVTPGVIRSSLVANFGNFLNCLLHRNSDNFSISSSETDQLWGKVVLFRKVRQRKWILWIMQSLRKPLARGWNFYILCCHFSLLRCIFMLTQHFVLTWIWITWYSFCKDEKLNSCIWKALPHRTELISTSHAECRSIPENLLNFLLN